MKIRVSRGACIGNARCLDVAPEVFALDRFAKAVIVNREGATDERILDAAQACPVQAIIVETDEGERIYPRLA